MKVRLIVSSCLLTCLLVATSQAGIFSDGVYLSEIGGTFDTGNLSVGATAFAPDILGQTSGPPQPIGFSGVHTTTGVNDGTYGNSLAWLSGTAGSHIGLDLGGSATVSSIAYGRDNNGINNDRHLGLVTLQYTNVASPTYTTPNSSWTTIGTMDYTGLAIDVTQSDRHRFNFDPVTVTGLRLITATAGRGIDEFEVYSAAKAIPTLTVGSSVVQDESTNSAGLHFQSNPISEPGDGTYHHTNGPGSFTWHPLFTSPEVRVEASWGVSINHSQDVDYFYDPDGAGPLAEIALLQDVDQSRYADQLDQIASGVIDWSGFLTIAEGLEITPEGLFRVSGTSVVGGVAPESLTSAAFRFTATPEPASIAIWCLLGLIGLGTWYRKCRRQS